MKVLQIINSLKQGGAEKLLVETSILYKKKGLHVEVLLLDGIKTPLYDVLIEQKIPIHQISVSKNIYNPINILKVRKYIGAFDVIQVHLFPALYWVAFANFLQLKRSKLVYTEHSSYNKRRNKLITKIIDRIVYKGYKKIVTIAKTVDENLKTHLGSRFKNFELINNGIFLEKFMTANPYKKEVFGFSANDIVIIQVSSFRYPKDQFTLIKALSNVKQTVKLMLVGEGPLINKAKSLVKELELQEHVIFLGNRCDVPRLLKTADIVVLSSHYEGLSLSCIEGMASGKPFIATDAPGLGEVVKGAGIIFEKNNDRQLSKIINKLINDFEYKNKIVSHCQERAKNFDINNMVSRYIEMYESL